MNEWFKKMTEQVGALWAKLSNTKRIIFFAIVGVFLVGIFLIFSFSSTPSMVPVLGKPITDEAVLDRITTRLDMENIVYSITTDKKVVVKDEKTARKAKAILARENLIPQGTEPYALFDVERWTLTDYERDINKLRAITSQIEQHITALDDIDSASVTLVIPKKELLAADQDPVTASIIITPTPGSDIGSNRKKIEGLERLVLFGVPGLKKESITINDLSGTVLNDWENMADLDKLSLKQRQLKMEKDYERQLISQINSALSTIYTQDRVVITNIKVDLDTADRTIEKNTITPIVIRPDNPDTPYDDSELKESIVESSKTYNQEYEGMQFNPEGPAGVEGQTPPGYKDLQETPGKFKQSEVITNNKFNEEKTIEDGRPQIRRVTASLAIDGIWKRVYKTDGTIEFNSDGSIKREYIALTPAEIKAAEDLLQKAIGYDSVRRDAVAVQNVQFDRSKAFAAEDDEIRRQEQTRSIILWSLVGVAIVLVFFIIFRLVSREIERRRRLREEELARQHQAMREAALRSAEEETNEVEMSVEDRARLELQEHAVNMAREHPEEVAQLIRTWLSEE